MPDTPTPTPAVPVDVITDLVSRYGKQALQLFAALAGATGLFYAIGFIIVNVSLLKLGLYETALISVGYVAPGIAFATLFTLIGVVTIGAFATWRRLIGATHFIRVFLVVELGLATVVAGSWLLGWVMWFGRNVASRVWIWSSVLGVAVAIMAYAEHIPVVRRMFMQRSDENSRPLSPLQARLKSPTFILISSGLLFASVLTYGQFVYDQIPPVFGGGLPIVVRFFGEDVGALEQVGIGLEPGQTNLTERVELMAQTEDRYIVRVANRAISFDKSFVQGIRYELPEFFLDEAYILATHTRQGERFLDDERYDQALSEFNLVLNREPTYLPALHGRIRVSLTEAQRDYDQALDDYKTLMQIESWNGENFYGLASVYVLRAQSRGQAIEVTEVVEALSTAHVISATLAGRTRDDTIFDPLRGNAEFDQEVYGSGPDAARWFRDKANLLVNGGAIDEAIGAFQRAITYTQEYASDPGALSPNEVATLHVALSTLYLQRDPRSTQAVEELEKAAQVPGLSSTEMADTYVALSDMYLQRDPLSDKALTALQAAVAATDEKDSTYLNRLGDLYRTRNETAEALATYDLALRQSTANDPNRRQALIGQGKTALESKDYLRATAAFSQALTLSASDAATWYDYARVLAALGDVGTEAALRRAIELDLNLAVTAQTADWQTYFSNAGSAVKNLIDGAVYYKQAREFRDHGDLDKAIAAYQQATSLDPAVARYWREWGDTLTQAKRYAEAVVAYQGALLRVEGVDTALLTSLGGAQMASGDAAGAVQSLSSAINAQGNATPATTYAALARAYEATGQYDLAAATYGQAALSDPSNLEYPYQAGIDLLMANQIDSGLAALSPVVNQGGLRVAASDGVGLRDAPSTNGIVLTTLTVGAQLRISANPQINEGEAWWPVTDQLGTLGFVRASDVVPSPPPVPAIQSTTP